MADKPVGEVVAVDAVLDGLSSPTSSDVYEALLPYSNDAAVASTASLALSGASPGGSQPGISFIDYIFTEEATAGVYTAPPLALLENAIVVDVQWWFDAAGNDWAADTAVIDIADSAFGAFVTAQDVKSSGGAVISASDQVVLQRPAVFPNLAGNADPAGGGELTVAITTTIAVPPVVPVCVMFVRVFYVVPPTPVPAVFA